MSKSTKVTVSPASKHPPHMVLSLEGPAPARISKPDPTASPLRFTAERPGPADPGRGQPQEGLHMSWYRLQRAKSAQSACRGVSKSQQPAGMQYCSFEKEAAVTAASTRCLPPCVRCHLTGLKVIGELSQCPSNLKQANPGARDSGLSYQTSRCLA